MSRVLRRSYAVGGESIECDLRLKDGRLQGSADGTEVDIPVRRLDTHTLRIDLDGRTVRATVARDGDTAWVCVGGRTLSLQVEEPGGGAAHHAGEEDFAVSPMTGTLVKVSAEVGEQVAEGAELFVVEAMKMEYVVRAPRTVTVAEVRATVGAQVDQGHVVVAYETASEESR